MQVLSWVIAVLCRLRRSVESIPQCFRTRQTRPESTGPQYVELFVTQLEERRVLNAEFSLDADVLAPDILAAVASENPAGETVVTDEPAQTADTSSDQAPAGVDIGGGSDPPDADQARADWHHADLPIDNSAGLHAETDDSAVTGPPDGDTVTDASQHADATRMANQTATPDDASLGGLRAQQDQDAGNTGTGADQEALVPSLLVVLDDDGHLHVTDEAEDAAQTLTLRYDSSTDQLVLASGEPLLDDGVGAAVSELRFALAEVSGQIRLDLGGGDDTLIVDFLAGNPIPAGGLVLDGGPGGDDALRIVSDGLAATYTPGARFGDGTITVGSARLEFTDLEPVDFDVTSGTFTLNLPGADDVVTISNSTLIDGVTPALRISGTSGGVPFENARVRNAAIVIDTVTGGTDGNDTITIASASNAHGNTDLTVNTGAGTDSVSFTGPAAFNGDVSITGSSPTTFTVTLQSSLDLFDRSSNTLSVTNTGGGAARLSVASGTLENATVAAGTALSFNNSLANRLTSVTVQGDLVLGSFSSLELYGGTTYTTARLTGQESNLRFEPGATIPADVIVEGATGGTRRLSVDGNGTLTIGMGVTVQLASSATSGQLALGEADETIINQGLISAEANGRVLAVNSSIFTNEGSLQASGGATLNATTSLTNLSGGTLTDGTYRVIGSSTMRLPGEAGILAATILLDRGGSNLFSGASGTNRVLTNLTSIAASGDLTIQGGKVLTVSGDLANANNLTIGIGSTLNVTGDYTQSAGTTRVNGLLVSTTSMVDINGGALRGTGAINGIVTNASLTAPGNSPGTLTINDDYEQSSSGSLEVEIASCNDFDQLIVNGAVLLSGTLDLVQLGGFNPSGDRDFIIITNDGHDPIVGTFDGLPEGSSIPFGSTAFTISYTGGDGNDVVLNSVGPAIAATLDGSGNLVVTAGVVGCDTQDMLLIQSDTANSRFIISDPGHRVGAPGIAGATQLDENTIVIPFSAVTGTRLTFNTLGGDDNLTVDFSLGDFSREISYDGGTSGATGDSLSLTGGSFADATFTYIDADTGSILVTGNSLINYDNLEPVSSTITAANVTLQYGAAAEAITVTGGGAGQTTVASTAGETTTFNHPTASLVINAGAGDDTINVEGLGAGFAADLTIDGGGDVDAVHLQTGATETGGGALIVTAESISITASIDTAGGDARLMAADGVTLCGAGADVTTGGGSLLVDADSDQDSVGVFFLEAGSAINTTGASDGGVSITAADIELRGTIHAGTAAVSFLHSVAGETLSLGPRTVPSAGATFPSPIEMSDLNGVNGYLFRGIDFGDEAGFSVSGVGDVDGDGFDDFLIGAHLADPNGSQSGESYLVFGGESNLEALDLADGALDGQIDLRRLNGANGFQLNGITSRDESGYSVSAAGDVNGDGFDDFLIGAPNAFFYFVGETDSYARGEAYVIFGDLQNLLALDAADGSADGRINLIELDGSTGFRIDGQSFDDHLGYSVSSAGDFNGDGVDDVVIGAQGKSFVIFGKDSGAFDPLIDLSDPTALNGKGFRIDGDGYSSQGGSFADVNGDGLDDVIIGVPNLGGNGQTYVVFGRSTPPAVFDLLTLLPANGGDGSAGIVIQVYNGGTASGAGDINGDGLDDLIIGAPFADSNGSSSGQSYVVFGSNSIGSGGTLELSSLDGTNGFALNGIASGDASGGSVSGAGDVNGDGIDDLIIGATGADPNGLLSGQSYVVFGSSSIGTGGVLELSSLNGTNGLIINGIDAFDVFGVSVSEAGDVNCDGVDDLIIGATGGDPNGRFSAGESYLVFGRQGTGEFSLDDAELDNVTAGRIVVGDASSGDVIVSANINPANTSSLDIISGGAIDSSDASNTITVATLDLYATSGIGATNPLRLDTDNLSAKLTADGPINLAEVDSTSVSRFDAGTGTVTLLGGTFLVTGSTAETTQILVESGATLGGDGVVGGPVEVLAGGTLAPGLSPEILDSGSLVLNTGSVLQVELNGTTPGPDPGGHDQLRVTGSVDLDADAGGGATLSILLGFTPAAGERFVIIDNDDADAVSGTFNGLPEGATVAVNGNTLAISYVGGDGNDVVLSMVVPEVEFAAAMFQVDEFAVGSMVVELRRSGDANTLARESQVQIRFTGGSATSADYSNAPIDVTFAANETTKTIVVPLINDALVEPAETIEMEVVAVTDATVGSQNTATLTILDDDALRVEFDRPAGGDTEALGENLPQLLVSGQVQDGYMVTIDVAVTGGSASVGSDFTAPTTLSVGPGTYAATAFALPSLAITDDAVVEPDETFDLGAITGSAVTVADTNLDAAVQDTTRYTIRDDDTLRVEFDRTADGDTESAGGNLPQLLVSGQVQTGYTVTIDVAVTGGTADASSDFIAATTLNVSAGTYAATPFALPSLAITDDEVVEPDETFDLGAITGSAVTVADTNLDAAILDTTRYTIRDDDTLRVEFDRPADGDTEAVGGNLPQLLVSGQVQNGHTVTIDVAVTGGTADAGSDFIAATTLNVSAGTYAATPFALPSLAITDDAVVEPDETFDLGGITGSAVTVADTNLDAAIQGTTRYTILDDDMRRDEPILVFEIDETTGNPPEPVAPEPPQFFASQTPDGTGTAGGAVVATIATIVREPSEIVGAKNLSTELDEAFVAVQSANQLPLLSIDQEELFFRIVEPDGQLGEKQYLILELLDGDRLIERFRTFPNDVYRIFFREAGASLEQQLYELNVFGNKIVPSAVFEEAAELPELDLENDPEPRPLPDLSPPAPEPQSSDEAGLQAADGEGELPAAAGGNDAERSPPQAAEHPPPVMTPRAAAVFAAATLIAGAPRGSWSRRVEQAMNSGEFCLNNTARLLRKLGGP